MEGVGIDTVCTILTLLIEKHSYNYLIQFVRSLAEYLLDRWYNIILMTSEWCAKHMIASPNMQHVSLNGNYLIYVAGTSFLSPDGFKWSSLQSG